MAGDPGSWGCAGAGGDVDEIEGAFGRALAEHVELPISGDAVDVGVVVAGDEVDGHGALRAPGGDGGDDARGEANGGVDEVAQDKDSRGVEGEGGGQEAGERLFDEAIGDGVGER